MNEVTLKKIQAIVNDAVANERLENATSLEEAVAILNELGVEVSVAEIEELLAKVPVGELSADDLEGVAGGAAWYKKVWGHIKNAVNGLMDGFLGSFTN